MPFPFPPTSFFTARSLCALAAFIFPVSISNVASAQQGPAPAAITVPATAPAGLEVTPSRATPSTRVTLSLPSGVAPPPRVRVMLHELGGRALAADVRRDARDWQMVDGRARTTLQIEAAPGQYELSLRSDDKKRTPLAFSPASLQITGIARTAGWWLPDGSPFVSLSGPTEPTSPLFIAGLQRSTGKKFSVRDVPLNFTAPWKLLPLTVPAEAWAAGYDAARLRTALQTGLAAAANERGFWGIGIMLEQPPADATRADAVRVFGLVREAAALAPDAALVFVAQAGGMRPAISSAAQDIAARCDAVFISARGARPGRANFDALLWAVKQMRRVAEEQPNFDLPVLVEYAPLSGMSQSHLGGAAQLDLFLAGATAFVPELQDKTRPSKFLELEDERKGSDQLRRLIERNRSLFVNSVTLEDIGILPVEDHSSITNEALPPLPISVGAPGAMRLYDLLRDAGRIPLLARSSGEEPESFAVALGGYISDDTVKALKSIAERGARIYIEGVPQLDEQGKDAGWKLKELVGADIAPLAKTSTEASRPVDMLLEDGWTFGTGRGTRVGVEQSVVVMLSKPTMSSQTKTEKGIFKPIGARAAARLEDGTPGLVINAIGKGEVVWLPHRIKAIDNPSWAVPDTYRPIKPRGRVTPESIYYAAVAAYIQPGLVTLRAAAPEAAPAVTPAPNAAAAPATVSIPGTPTAALGSRGTLSTTDVRVALRRTAKGSLLLGLFNDADTAARIDATVDGVAGVALDLATETALPLDVRGFASTATVTVPAHGWSLIAFGATPAALDTERAAPLGRATMR